MNSVAERESKNGSAICIRGLKKRFHDVEAVSGIDLEVAYGEIFGLVGPDGAGKTTTMRMLCGILDVTEGAAQVLGYDVVQDPEAVKREIGYMSQRFSLYGDLTVRENMLFFANLYHVPKADRLKREEELLHAARMEPFCDRLAMHLSGGMKQKLALMCTLIHAPKLLFLDEPTTGVDPVSRRDFWRILYAILQNGATIFVSTPYMDEAERCNRVALMDKGRILRCDTPEKLRCALPGEMWEVIGEPQEMVKRGLERIPGFREVQVFGDRLHAWFAAAGQSESRLRDLLKTEHVSVTSLRKIQPGLEDVFIAVVKENR